MSNAQAAGIVLIVVGAVVLLIGGAVVADSTIFFEGSIREQLIGLVLGLAGSFAGFIMGLVGLVLCVIRRPPERRR